MTEIFNKQDKFPQLVSPISGKCISIEEVADPTFSSKVLGNGFAVIPSSNIVVSPMAGVIKYIPDTLHAFLIETMQGIQLLVHVGLETVRLEGKGFKALAHPGAKIKAGTPVIQFDEAYIKERNLDMTTIVIFLEKGPKDIKLRSFGSYIRTGEELKL